MDFIVENYVWFIVGGVIILMAVIGYIADKTDFGRKGKDNQTNEEKPKKESKPKKTVEKKEKIKVEAKGINELTQKATQNGQMENNPVLDTKTNISQNNENIDQSLFAPLSDKPTEIVPQANEPTENLELKNIEPVKLDNVPQENSNQTVAEDEDIWKF